MDEIFTRKSGHITTIILNAPERRNALNYDMWRQFAVVLGKVKSDKTTKDYLHDFQDIIRYLQEKFGNVQNN